VAERPALRFPLDAYGPPLVGVLARYSTEYEHWWFEHDMEPADADGDADSFWVEVPADLVRKVEETQAAAGQANQALLEAANLTEHGSLSEPCDSWEGTTAPPATTYRLRYARTYDGHSRHVELGHSRDRATVEADMARLPDTLHVSLYGHLVEVAKADLKIDTETWPGWTSRCHRCGWAHADHGGGVEL